MNSNPIHYNLQGSGNETIILIHGYAVHSGMWDHIVDKLTQSYQVLTLDLRGHGKSDKPHQGYSVEVFAEDIYALTAKLNIKKPILLGWSLGGYIAQYYATHYPIKKLILACTAPTWVPEKEFPFGSTPTEHKASYHKLLKTPDDYYEDCVNANFTDSDCSITDKKHYENNLRKTLKENDIYALAAIIDYFTKKPASLIKNLAHITVPTLIISGNNDPISPPAVSRFMKERIKDAILNNLPYAGHSLIQTKSQDFLKIVMNFLESSQQI